MDKRLINTLLKVYRSEDTRFWKGRGLLKFCAAYNLGLEKSASIVFTERDKAEIGKILKGEMGIEAETTTPESWNNLSRSQSLNIAQDEKLSRRAVSTGRLRVKAIPGRAVSVCGGCWNLPPRTDLGVVLEAVLGSKIGHDALLVVENGETFDDFWAVRPEVLAGMEALNALVLFRGDAEGGARADAVNALIEHTVLPVYAFVDFDPAGMVIAAGLPRLDQVLSPTLSELETVIRAHGITKRYLDQVAAAKHVLERLENDPRISPLWKTIQMAGKGLPQEFFHR